MELGIVTRSYQQDLPEPMMFTDMGDLASSYFCVVSNVSSHGQTPSSAIIFAQ